MADVTRLQLEALRKAHKTLGDEMRALRNDNFILAQALRIYRYCRHGSINCFCVKEARAALWEDKADEPNVEKK